MKRLCYTFLCTVLLLASLHLEAQKAQDFEHIIHSEAFEKERSVLVHLPRLYAEDSSQLFLVTYILDAQLDEFWNMAKSNISYLVLQRQIIPMIVVGIPSDNRGSEFAPTPTQLQNHLKNEVFPLIEANYRVHPFNVIVGHSWGGAFVGHTLFSEEKDMFNAYIGISPSFDAMGDIIVKNAASFFSSHPDLNKFLYASAGDIGIREIESDRAIHMMDSVINMFPNKSLIWETAVFEDKDHWTCVIPSINDGLLRMSRHYFADQKVMTDFANQSDKDLRKQIKDFYERQQDKYGFIYKPSARYLNFVASDFSNQGDHKSAIALYEWAIEKAPNILKIHIGLTNAYDQMGDQAMTKSSCQKTLALLEEQKADFSERYYNNLHKWAEEILTAQD